MHSVFKQTVEGMQTLLSELSTTPDTAAAVAFIATSIKYHGAISAAVQLYCLAVSQEPTRATLALNLMHALELQQDMAAVVQVAQSFCQAVLQQGTNNTGNLPLQVPITCI